MKDKNEDWIDHEKNIMRIKRLRYLGYSDEEIKKIKSGKEADKIIEAGKKEARMDEREILAKNLRLYRQVKGLKQTELAAKVGLTSDTICRIETARQENIGSKYLVSISRELDVELFQLFMADPEALTIKLVVSDQNLRSAKRLLDEIVKRAGDKISLQILKG